MLLQVRLFYVYSFFISFSSDMLLAMAGALEHDLLRCSFVTHFGFWSFGLDLRSSLFVPSFRIPFWVLWLMEFARISSFSFLVCSVKHGINPFCYLLTAILIIAKWFTISKLQKYLNPPKHFFKNFTKGLQFLKKI